jgi:hypothetical protein
LNLIDEVLPKKPTKAKFSVYSFFQPFTWVAACVLSRHHKSVSIAFAPFTPAQSRKATQCVLTPSKQCVSSAFAWHCTAELKTTCVRELPCLYMRNSFASLAEAVAAAVRQPRVRRQAIELSDEAASRVRALLDARHKVCVVPVHVWTSVSGNSMTKVVAAGHIRDRAHAAFWDDFIRDTAPYNQSPS